MEYSKELTVSYSCKKEMQGALKRTIFY